jgi:triosephosphate isomerase
LLPYNPLLEKNSNMRKQIAAANWKMNLTLQQGEQLLDAIISKPHSLKEDQQAIFAVPSPYLQMAQQKLSGKQNVFVAAQNCYSKKNGAFTGEVSVEMLGSLNIQYVVIGHSERREYFHESNQLLADKVTICLENKIHPIFCCGEPLDIREAETQNEYVAKQLEESLYHLSAEQLLQVVVAYEPIWAIGTGKTASSAQAQEMHAYIRQQLAGKFGNEIADAISILYGGSVKAVNAVDIFSQPDVDGGLVGGASLIADEFVAIINALK